MLILSRRKNESVVVDGTTEITVLDIARNHVKLGIEAPRSVAVFRKEICQQARQGGHQAAEAADRQDLGKLAGH